MDILHSLGCKEKIIKMNKNNIYYCLFLLVISLIISSICYRYQIINGFKFEFGDNYDDIIEISLMEHWYNVIFNHEIWSSTQYFYPHEKTIGYTDGYFLLGLVYSLIRLLGSGPILANDITGFCLHIIGFLSFYAMVRNIWKFSKTSSIIGSSIFCASNNIWIQGGTHIQLFVIFFIPIIVNIFYFSFLHLFKNEKYRFFMYFCAGSIIYSSCLLTAFYMMWFFTLFSIILFIIYFSRKINRNKLNQKILEYRNYIIPCIIIVIVSMIPFLYIYIEKAHETGMHHWKNAKYYVPPFISFINVGKDNIIYNWIISSIPNGEYNKNPEFDIGFTPFVFLFSICYFIFLRSDVSKFWRSLCISIIVSIILSTHIGRFYPWHIIFNIVPGAKSMRVVARFLIFLSLPLCVLLSLSLNLIQEKKGKYLVVLLGTFLFSEQLNAANIINLNREKNNLFYNSIPNPPQSCKSFFVIDAPPAQDDLIYDLNHANDPAMLYSEIHHIHTIVGFTTFYPPDWQFKGPYMPDIIIRANEYAQNHHIQNGLCSLNLETKEWNTAPFASLSLN